MIYKFKSKATGDMIMLGANGDALLRLVGREPAAQGIIEVGAMAAAIIALRQATEADDAARAGGAKTAEPGSARDTVSLRRRVWPMVEMLQRARAGGEPIVWGV